jgi:predicted PurR-regulated permease PerM
VDNIIDNLSSYSSIIFKISKPFIWAFVIAYLLNPIMIYLEKKFRIKRLWSILIVYIFFLGLLSLVLVIITPKIISGISNIIQDVPSYIEKTQRWLAYQQDSIEFIGQYRFLLIFQKYLGELNYENLLDQFGTSLSPILDATLAQAINITSGIFNLLFAIIISVYFLKDKEKFIIYFKRIIYAFLDKEKADKVTKYCKEFNSLVSKFLIGKIIDSLIIGILCFIGTLIIGAPYPIVISTIVGVTNMIPYVGPIIGAVPCVIITLFYNPITAVWIALFILALQQFDGLYLGPKILGTQVGLSPLWIITAIIIGGGLFGIIGMLLAVPVIAILRTAINKFISIKLKEKNIHI